MVRQQQRGTKAPAAAASKVDAPDPILFFALGPAAFTDTIVVTKVISVVLPLKHLRDRTVLHEVLLKKLLYRAYEPSAEDLAQQQQSLSQDVSCAAAAAPSSTSASPAPFVILHIKSTEILADTARQVNPAGDVQVNVMTALVAARVRHGICAGVAEASPYASCMEVRVPTVRVSAAVAARGGGGLDDAAGIALTPEEAHTSQSQAEAAGTDAGEGDDDAVAGPARKPRAARSGIPAELQLRITARCLEEEPVVPGQAVLLISEPAVMRCMAVRPPRDAPGPFSLVEGGAAAEADHVKQGAGKVAPKKGGARKSRAASGAAAAAPRRVVAIECALPLREGDGEARGAGGAGKSKRPRA